MFVSVSDSVTGHCLNLGPSGSVVADCLIVHLDLVLVRHCPLGPSQWTLVELQTENKLCLYRLI
jgi:hypothetical protein